MTDQPFNKDCIFCRIIKGEMPSSIRYESDHVFAFDDINPKAPTHVLICPKGHYPTFLETPADVLDQLNNEVKVVAKKIGVEERGFRLVINNGEESGQLVFHLHYHLLTGSKLPGF